MECLDIQDYEEERKRRRRTKIFLSDDEDEVFDVDLVENENNWINDAIPTGELLLLKTVPVTKNK